MTVISRMILHLEAGLVFARKAMAEIEETMANDSSADDTAESAEEIVAEEIADVSIMLEQMKFLLNCNDEVSQVIQKKIERTYERDEGLSRTN